VAGGIQTLGATSRTLVLNGYENTRSMNILVTSHHLYLVCCVVFAIFPFAVSR